MVHSVYGWRSSADHLHRQLLSAVSILNARIRPQYSIRSRDAIFGLNKCVGPRREAKKRTLAESAAFLARRLARTDYLYANSRLFIDAVFVLWTMICGAVLERCWRSLLPSGLGRKCYLLIHCRRKHRSRVEYRCGWRVNARPDAFDHHPCHSELICAIDRRLRHLYTTADKRHQLTLVNIHFLHLHSVIHFFYDTHRW